MYALFFTSVFREEVIADLVGVFDTVGEAHDIAGELLREMLGKYKLDDITKNPGIFDVELLDDEMKPENNYTVVSSREKYDSTEYTECFLFSGFIIEKINKGEKSNGFIPRCSLI